MYYRVVFFYENLCYGAFSLQSENRLTAPVDAYNMSKRRIPLEKLRVFVDDMTEEEIVKYEQRLAEENQEV